MDDFGCFDYQRPVSSKDTDWRTSTYRGHHHLTDLRMGNQLNVKFADKDLYVRDPLLSEKPTSEHMANYVWQYGNPNALRNPTLSNDKTHYMKPFEHEKLRFIKRRMKPISSVSHDTYVHKEMPEDPEVVPVTMPTPVKATKIIIDRSDEGYSKYLDPSATTYNLSYVRLSPEKIASGVGAQDNLTFWNWSEKNVATRKVMRVPDPIMCDDLPSKQCPNRREFQNLLKRVPNAGMVTEVRANYTDPHSRLVDFDPNVRPTFEYTDVVPFAKKSEYAMYGSGEPVVTYV